MPLRKAGRQMHPLAKRAHNPPASEDAAMALLLAVERLLRGTSEQGRSAEK